MKGMMTALPHTINYCWFGGNQKPVIIEKCIESWKKYMPEWEIVEWNEDNYNVMAKPYTRDAYKAKKWAFVSDYARFDIIYRYGGIYLDTDVELLKPIPNEVLLLNSFTGFESAGKVNPGLIYADLPGGEVTRLILQCYENIVFDLKNLNSITVNEITSSVLKPYGLQENNQLQIIHGMTIFPSSVFCGFDQDVKEIDIREDTISVHHYAGTWARNTLKRRLRNIIKKYAGVDNYKTILLAYREVRKLFKKDKIDAK